MKLISITIKNYRIHKELKVEFDAARTVIGGSNEAGKSTLVEAVHNALFLRSRSTGAVQKAMLSEIYGGHPTVELMFESGGKTYSITKVFTGSQSASTTFKEYASAGSTTGGTAAKTRHNEDAEARIHEILQAEDVGGGRNLDQRLKHQWAGLWVWQESATRDPLVHANADRHAELLRERLSRIDGGGVLESPLDASVSSDVAARLHATFTDTDTGRPRSGSNLDRAIKAREAADAAHDHAAATVTTLNAAVDTIDWAGRTLTLETGRMARQSGAMRPRRRWSRRANGRQLRRRPMRSRMPGRNMLGCLWNGMASGVAASGSPSGDARPGNSRQNWPRCRRSLPMTWRNSPSWRGVMRRPKRRCRPSPRRWR